MNKHINKHKEAHNRGKVKAPFKQIFVPIIHKSRAGVEYTHYKTVVVENK